MAYPFNDTMPTPSAGAYHLFAPGPAEVDKALCFFCNQNQAAHYPPA